MARLKNGTLSVLDFRVSFQLVQYSNPAIEVKLDAEQGLCSV